MGGKRLMKTKTKKGQPNNTGKRKLIEKQIKGPLLLNKKSSDRNK
jgi:hypothetical protein